MSVPKKKAVVSKKITDEIALNAKRWEAFVINCQIPWENLDDNWKDFYASMGNTESSEEDINNAIDLARGVK